MTYFITIAGRRWPVEKRSKRERTPSAGTSPRPTLRSHLPAHRADRPRPAPRRRHPGRARRRLALPRQPRSPRTAPSPSPPSAPLTCRSTPAPRRCPPGGPALPARHPADQAVHAETAGSSASPATESRTHQPRPPRLPPPLVSMPQAPPGPRPLAPLQHPPGSPRHLTQRPGRR